MDRWWDDPVASAAALGSVRSGDVVAGVGAALLAYHGVSKGLLDPLASSTLVDAGQVADALDGVDVDAVGRAFAEATRPVMGAAADAYGALLAEDVHRRAVDSTVHLVQFLAAGGVDWPSAVARAACVHGVPGRSLGPVLKSLRAERLGSLALADCSDRALMGYAHRLGARESAVFDPVRVGKADRVREREFDEGDVVRGPDGRFRDKPDGGPTPYARRKKRRLQQMKRRAAQWERFTRHQRMLQQSQQQDQQQDQRRVGERRDGRVQSRDQSRKPLERSGRSRVRRKPDRSDAPGNDPGVGMTELPPLRPGELFDGTMHRPHSKDAYFIVVPNDVFLDVMDVLPTRIDSVDFSGLWLDDVAEQSSDHRNKFNLRVYTANELVERAILENGMDENGEIDLDYSGERSTLIKVTGQLPLVGDNQEYLALGAMLTAYDFTESGSAFDDLKVPTQEFVDEDGEHFEVTPYLEARIIHAKLTNPHDFHISHWGATDPYKRTPRGEGGLPHDFPFRPSNRGDSWTGGKRDLDDVNKSRERVREFDEGDVRRDSMGRFADKPDVPDSRVLSSRERYQRRKKRRLAQVKRRQEAFARFRESVERESRAVGEQTARSVERKAVERKAVARREVVRQGRLRTQLKQARAAAKRRAAGQATQDRPAGGGGANANMQVVYPMDPHVFSTLFFRDPITGETVDWARTDYEDDPSMFRVNARALLASEIRPAMDVVSSAHHVAAAKPIPAKTISDYPKMPKNVEYDLITDVSAVFHDPQDAYDAALTVLEEGFIQPDFTFHFVPWAKPVSGLPEGKTLYRPALRHVNLENSEVMVFVPPGFADDFARDPLAFDVTPLSEDWHHPMSSFDEVLMQYGPEDVFQDNYRSPKRSDFYVHAFVVKRRQNGA